MTPIAELVARIERGLPLYGLTPSAARVAALARYLELVQAANARVRLVGSSEADLLIRRHLGESLALGAIFPLASQRLVDLGSGAGFPGFALALAFPQLQTTLVESTRKKANFLTGAAEALGVAARVAVLAEYLPRRPPAPTPLGEVLAQAELVTVRALERMAEVPAWLWRWLRPGTACAFWISSELAVEWRRDFPGWGWSELHRLPDAASRGIVLGTSVSRGTMPEA